MHFSKNRPAGGRLGTTPSIFQKIDPPEAAWVLTPNCLGQLTPKGLAWPALWSPKNMKLGRFGVAVAPFGLRFGPVGAKWVQDLKKPGFPTPGVTWGSQWDPVGETWPTGPVIMAGYGHGYSQAVIPLYSQP